jgi:cytochrome P450
MIEQPSVHPFVRLTQGQFDDDPYPLYEELRTGPIVPGPGGMLLLLSREIVDEVLRSSRFGHHPNGPPPRNIDSESEGLQELLEAMTPAMFLHMDPPDHTRIRRIVTRAFTPRAVERLTGVMERVTDRALAAAAASGRMELMSALARPLPVTIIAELLGIPEEDRPAFVDWGRVIATSSGLEQSEQDVRRGDKAAGAFVEYIASLVERRRREPGEDLLSELVGIESQGERLTLVELIATAFLLLFAGYETTVNLIGNGTLALLRNPAQYQALRRRPEMIPNAIEELLRYDPPVQLTNRTALEEVRLAGIEIPRGTEVLTMIAAANRDPAVFHDPAALDVTRSNAGRHLSFGAGIHFCLGAPLARLEARVAFATLISRFDTIALDVPPAWRPGFTFRGLESLPMVLTPGA